VLIIRPSALGDVARTVPALVSLKHAWPDAGIDWLVREGYEPVLAHHPALAETLAFPAGRDAETGKGRAVRMLDVLSLIRRRRYDLVIDLQGLARSGIMTGLSRAAHRVGFADARELAWLGYNQRIDAPRTLHAVTRTLKLIAGLGIEPVTDLSLYVGDEDRAWFANWADDVGVAPGRFLCIAPTARWQCKCWPATHFAEAAERLLAESDLADRVVVLASPAEREMVKPMLDRLGTRAAMPSTHVGQLMAVLAKARLLLCNDSAPLHLAVGLHTPLVSIFAATDPGLVGPYQRDASVVLPDGWTSSGPRLYRQLKDDASWISQITVEQVVRAAHEELERTAGQS